MIPLAQVLAWKLGNAYRLAGTSTRENLQTGEMELVDWNEAASGVPRPTPAQITTLIAQWQAAGSPDPFVQAEPLSVGNFKALIRRGAEALENDGDQIAALLLLKTIGE